MENEQTVFRELKAGTTLSNGKYIIEKVIGEGGFGITYLGMQSGLNRKVAIKEFFMAGRCVRNTQRNTVIVQGSNKDKELFEKYREKFIDEGQTLAKLDHIGIVKVIDVILDENNTSYIVMAFIEGKTLQQIVEDKGKLEYHEAVNYIGQLGDAITYIHQRSILHRDIKPDNIIITPENKIILIDFGSARQFVHDKTQDLTSVLTKGYAPLEQYSGTSRKGGYSDIYAIGATLYFCLTGEKPMDVTDRLGEEKMPEPKELNPKITDDANRTVWKAMQVKALYRHQTMKEFMDDLLGVKPSEPIDEKAEEKKKTRRIILISAIIGLIAICATIFLMRNNGGDAVIDYGEKDIAGIGYPMVLVKGGTFMMGSAEERDENPLREVSMNDFHIGIYEVSQKLWETIMGNNPSRVRGENLPVVNVSWYDVQEFIKKLNAKTGKQFALPTEIEWEYAARGGQLDSNFVYSGANHLGVAWYKKSNLNGVVISQEIQQIGQKRRNQLGIYDMSGNAREWCLDVYTQDHLDFRVVRGGSFASDDDEDFMDLRNRARDGKIKNQKDEKTGFRLVLRK